VAVLVLSVDYGHLPWVALVLAFLRVRILPAIAAGVIWIALQFVVLTVFVGAPWGGVVGLLVGGATGGILVPVPALILLARRTLRPLIAGFVPIASFWIVISAAVGIVLVAIGIRVDGTPTVQAMGLGGLAACAGIAIAVWRIRGGTARGFALWWTLGVVLLAVAEWASPSLWFEFLLGVGVNGSLAFIGWALFTYFLRLKARGRMPDEVLHFSGCWFALGVWSFALSRLDWFQVHWALLPFVVYALTLYVLLDRLSRSLIRRIPKRLLLLRVFHESPDSWLMDALDDSWRRVGTVETMVGLDLALRTLNALALENYLAGNVNSLFLHSEADALERLSRLPTAIALDGRFPLNELHGRPRTWQYAVRWLIDNSDLVLMDLRGLQSRNRCCIFELALAVQRVSPPHLVLLTDDRSDEQTLRETVQNAWSTLPDDSRNRSVAAPTLNVLRCSKSGSDDVRSVIGAVFVAGFGNSARRVNDPSQRTPGDQLNAPAMC